MWTVCVCVCTTMYNVHRYDTYILCSYIQICYTYTYACKRLLYYTCPEVRSHCIWWGLSQQLGTWVNTINSLYKLINIWTMIKDWCISGRTVDSDIKKKKHIPSKNLTAPKLQVLGQHQFYSPRQKPAYNRHIRLWPIPNQHVPWSLTSLLSHRQAVPPWAAVTREEMWLTILMPLGEWTIEMVRKTPFTWGVPKSWNQIRANFVREIYGIFTNMVHHNGTPIQFMWLS